MAKRDNDKRCITNWKTLQEKGYFQNHNRYKDWALNALKLGDKLNDFVGISKDDDALDIGCGYGRLMYRVADSVNTVTGIDLHEGLLIKARDILKDKPNTKVVLCDGQSIPLEDDTITLAYSFCVMQHIPRSIVRKYLVDTMRVLKPGGRIFFQFLAAPRGNKDIDSRIVKEQSVGWTAQEMLEATKGLDGTFEVRTDANVTALHLIGKV